MVIQRIQTLWLLLASVIVAIYSFLPKGVIASAELDSNSATIIQATDIPVLLVVELLIAVLLFIAIFLFKNTKRQKRVTIISMLLIVVSEVTELMLHYRWASYGGKFEWLGSTTVLFGALIFAALALKGINHDEKLLRSAARLR